MVPTYRETWLLHKYAVSISRKITFLKIPKFYVGLGINNSIWKNVFFVILGKILIILLILILLIILLILILLIILTILILLIILTIFFNTKELAHKDKVINNYKRSLDQIRIDLATIDQSKFPMIVNRTCHSSNGILYLK